MCALGATYYPFDPKPKDISLRTAASTFQICFTKGYSVLPTVFHFTIQSVAKAMVHCHCITNISNSVLFNFLTLSIVRHSNEHNVSETGSISDLGWKGGGAPTLLSPLDGSKNSAIPDCYTPSLESFRIDGYERSLNKYNSSVWNSKKYASL
jgi:hypothetical protein